MMTQTQLERKRERMRDYYAKNREKIRAQAIALKRKFPARYVKYNEDYYAGVKVDPCRMLLRRKRSLARAKRLRLDWVAANGPCCICGSIVRLEIDHIDRATKVSTSVFSWTPVKRDAELAKCQVLCRICHREKTNREVWGVRQHGQVRMYEAGCRCLECRTAKSTYVKAWKAKRVAANVLKANRRATTKDR